MVDDLADDLLPPRCLVCASIFQAVRDCGKPTSKEGLEAQRWLKSREAEEWCLGWGIDLRKVRKIVAKSN